MFWCVVLESDGCVSWLGGRDGCLAGVRVKERVACGKAAHVGLNIECVACE